GKVGEVRRGDARVAVRERLVDEMDDRHLVPFGKVEGEESVADALLEVAGGEDDPRAFPVSRVQRESEVSLFVSRRHPRARPGPLIERDDERDLVDRGPT